MALPIELTNMADRSYRLLGGSQRVNNVNDNSTHASNFRDVYTLARLEALTAHPWNFAVTRAEVMHDPVAPVGAEWEYRFKLPTDCLRWLPWPDQHVEYFCAEEEDGWLLTNEEGPLIVRYIRDNEDVTSWSAAFVTVLCFQCAYELCEIVAASQSVRDRMEAGRDRALTMARRQDGAATGQRNRAPAHHRSRLVAARLGRGDYGHAGDR
jgi:hypothetical protein